MDLAMLAGRTAGTVLAPNLEFDARQRLADRRDTAADQRIVGGKGGAMILWAEQSDRRTGLGQAIGVAEGDARQHRTRPRDHRVGHMAAAIGEGRTADGSVGKEGVRRRNFWGGA